MSMARIICTRSSDYIRGNGALTMLAGRNRTTKQSSGNLSCRLVQLLYSYHLHECKQMIAATMTEARGWKNLINSQHKRFSLEV